MRSSDDDDPPGGDLTDEELTAEALAADPDRPLGPDAVPFADEGRPAGLLPEWYMPTPMSRRRTPLRMAVVAFVVLAFLAASAAGLCTTNGFAEIAW
ncbi:MAG: hypothetical protein M3337_01080 [Actinomycetota bacterium]|nr:hypothetical protein [Actinomycetota bacterium]